MADACGTPGAGGSTSSNPNVISFAGCVEASCDCIVLTGGVRTLSSPTAVSVLVSVGAGAVVETLDAPAWSTVTVVGSDLLITGTAPVGLAALVYEVSNECSKECVVVKLTVTGSCVPPVDIVRDIGYTNNDFQITTDITIPTGSTFVSGTIPNAQYVVYAVDLAVSATLQQPLPTTYSISMNTPCGPYTISGSLVECKVPRLVQVTGGSVFEVGVPYAMSWIIEATSVLAIASQEGVPLGGTLAIAQSTPSVGFATVTLAGVPTENTGAGEIKFVLRGQCGTLAQGRRFSQQGCRALQVVGEFGNNQFVFDGLTPVNFCKVVRGYEPTVAEFSGLPLGLEVTVSPAAIAGDWRICITGIHRVDPCVKPEEDAGDLLCKCADVKLKNECGTVDIKICYNLDLASFVPKPSYCIGVFDYNPVTRIARVWGVVPFSTATLIAFSPEANFNPTPTVTLSIPTDATGFGQITVPLNVIGTPYSCFGISHPTCALVQQAPSVRFGPCPTPPDNSVGN